MEIVGISGKKYRWNPSKAGKRKTSGLHLRCRELLKQIYPTDPVCEEVFLPGCSSKLYVDFYLPVRKKLIEVQGEQHYKPVSFSKDSIDASGGRLAFLRAKARDAEKVEWANLNKLTLITLPFNETEKWKELICE